jgi:hypothetical protein
MGVEQAALCAVAGVLRSKPGTVITARLIDTQANQPCRGVYADAGFIAGPDGALLPADLVLRPPASVRVETSLEA